MKELLLKNKWMMTLALVVCVSGNVFAQSVLVTGIVFSDEFPKDPVPGVNVLVKGTSIGTITDFNGKFTLIVPIDTTLVISYIGHETKELKIKTGGHYEIILKSTDSSSNSFFSSLQRKMPHEKMIAVKEDMDYLELSA